MYIIYRGFPLRLVEHFAGDGLPWNDILAHVKYDARQEKFVQIDFVDCSGGSSFAKRSAV
ncbi:hypothetical protein RR42_m3379 [Cupriavidus basilensis]|uniref:Uncharacterized protein n=1 Tax=Cupriavidus basilensis TaxID=68895 RepID=A0A0C4Y5S1_9BURK|nr:hypothetical protein RR42_m3379 [Cupriavidus basilensis]